MQKILQCPDGHVCECTPSQLLDVVDQATSHLRELFRNLPTTPPDTALLKLRWFLESAAADQLTANQYTILERLVVNGGETSIYDLSERKVWRLDCGQTAPTDSAINQTRTRINTVLAPHGLRVSMSCSSHFVRIHAD